MSRLEKLTYRRLHVLRRIVQISALVFIVAVPVLNKLDLNFIIGTYYSLSIGNLDIIDPALVLQFLLINKSLTFSILLAGLIPLLLAFFLGKVFCSWVCPFNLFAEWVEKLRNKFKPRPGRNYNPPSYRYWLILASFLLLIAVSGISLINFISMPGLISSQIADLFFGGIIGIEMLLVVGVLILEFAIAPRFWCKYVCPVGAVLELPRNRKTMKIHFLPDGKCICDGKQPACNIHCPMHLDPRRPDIHPYCYNCGECIGICHAVGGEKLFFNMKSENTKAAKKTHLINTEVHND